MVAREHEVAVEQETAVAAGQEPPTRSKAETDFRKRKQKRKQAIQLSTEKLELPPMPPPPGVPPAVAAEQKTLEHHGEHAMPPLVCSMTFLDKLKDETFQVTLNN